MRTVPTPCGSEMRYGPSDGRPQHAVPGNCLYKTASDCSLVDDEKEICMVHPTFLCGSLRIVYGDGTVEEGIKRGVRFGDHSPGSAPPQERSVHHG